MSIYIIRAAAAARFDPVKGAKSDLVAGEHLFLGLNCFEPGQQQATHTHAAADKFYLLLAGTARMRVGDEAVLAEAGDLVWCPAHLPHGVEEALERTVMLVGISPPPRAPR